MISWDRRISAMALHVSDDLMTWAAMAGYRLTPEDQSGGAVFSTDPGGEIRFFLRRSAKDVYIVSSAQRASAEQYELYGTSMKTIERYLFGIFGSDVRSRRLLPRLIIPTEQGHLAPGYSLDESDDDGFTCLRDPNGLVAKARGRVTSTSTLTKLSHLLSAALPDVRTSYEDPDGRPLFATHEKDPEVAAEAWRGAVNMILYGMLFKEDLDGANAAITADAIIEYRSFVQGPAFFLDAIQDALATDAPIMTEMWAEPPHGMEELRHSEEGMRRFLGLIADELRRRQPWPPKPETGP